MPEQRGLPAPGDLARRIDSTLLKPTAGATDFRALCEDAARQGFWSVCVPPSRVKLASAALKGTGVRVCAVVGFPLGYSTSEAKAREAAGALSDGADEIDMVMNIGDFLASAYGPVSADIRSVAGVCRGSGGLLKVIVECCYLDDAGKARAALLAADSGADYVKTSTGFGPSGATPGDVALLVRALGGRAKVKAAGGISDLARALQMVEAGADRIGTSSGAKILAELRAAQAL